MGDFYRDAREFIHALVVNEQLPKIEVAKFCGISWQVVTAICSDPSYDMGTITFRKILRKKIEYDKRIKREESWAIVTRLIGDDKTAYKGTRNIEAPKYGNRISEMKPL